MAVAVTGGTGVVGASLVRRLVAGGDPIRASCRSQAAADDLAAMGAEPVGADVLDRDSLVSLFDGVDVVFNVAGVNQLCPRDPGALWKVNVEGARNVLEACRLAGVRRLVHTSSAVTIGEPAGSIGDEGTPHRGHYLSHYERSKAESERMLMSAQPDDIEVVVVNPSSVQGPGRSTGTGRLLLEAARGRTRVLVDSVFSLVDIDDCAHGHILASERGIPGERYILSGVTLSTREVVAIIDGIMGRSASTMYIRPGVFRALGSVSGALHALLGRQAPLCSESVRVMLHGHRYDGSKATRELGLEYQEVEDTLDRTVDWFRAGGLLD